MLRYELTISETRYCETEIRYVSKFGLLSKSGLEFMNQEQNVLRQ